MAHRIDTVDARSKLPPRSNEYWHKLSTGRHVGFRKMSPLSAGTWIARIFDTAKRTQVRRSLGSFDDVPAHQRFDLAKKAAEAWFEHLGRGGSLDPITVLKACEQYEEHVRANGAMSNADDLKARFKRWIKPSPIASVELPKLTRKQIDSWRQKLADTPVIVNPYAPQPERRTRSASSVNRDMSALRAALNFAHDNGDATSDLAWRVALRPIANADGRRDAYLNRPQRTELISKARADVANYLRGLSLVPLRPGALAALTVASFEKHSGVLTVGKDKAGGDRRIKLPTETAAYFAAQTKDKLPGAPLVARWDGKAWDKDAWKKPIREAARAANLPDVITAYAMRHSVITDLVIGGLDLLTVAQLSGTSVAMIERHYGHLRADHAAAALARLAL